MSALQKVKIVKITPPQAIVDNASWTTSSIDTLGYSHCDIVVHLGALDIAMVALKVQESNDDGSSDSYTDVTGLIFGTSNNITGSASTLPAATDDNKFFLFSINLQGRDRYLDLVATGGDGATGTYLTAFAVLSGGDEQKLDATSLGYSQILAV
jgi:hypothetical protein